MMYLLSQSNINFFMTLFSLRQLSIYRQRKQKFNQQQLEVNKFIILHSMSIHPPSAYQVQSLVNFSRCTVLKHSKQVYNQKEARDIIGYMNKIQEMKRKAKTQEETLISKNKKKYKPYNDNQSLQLSFKWPIDDKNQTHLTSSIRKPEKTPRQKKGSLLKQRRGDLTKKRFDKKQALSSLPWISRTKTQNDIEQITKPKNLISIPSPKRLKQKHREMESSEKKKLKQLNDEPSVVLREEQIKQYLDYFANLFKGKSRIKDDYFVETLQINRHLMKRYSLKSIIIQDQGKSFEINPIEFPFCQFVGYREARKSIFRIFDMPLWLIHKIVFKIYDRNHNGVIDEKDLIQLFEMSEKSFPISRDLEILVKNYQIIGGSDRYKNPKSIQQFSQISHISIKSEKKPSELKFKKFKKEKFFTFLESKHNFFQKKTEAFYLVGLKWQDFQKAFFQKRPYLFYDILDFLFGCSSQKMYDSKSFQKLSALQKQNNRSKFQTQPIDRMTTQKIKKIIKKTSSIQKLTTCKL